MVAKARSVVCVGQRRDGSPCQAPATIGPYCIGHAPSLADKRQAARRQGGRNKARSVRLSKLMPIRLIPIFERLETALTELHEGTLDPRAGAAMASVAGALIRCLQAGEIEERLRRLEERQPNNNGRRWPR